VAYDRGKMRKAIKVVLGCLVALILIVGAFAAWLIYPGSPGPATSLKFQGYILLPKGRTLNVLDYLTVSGSNLFVTDESAGNVYKVGLREGTLPSPADISVFALEPATHGVVIDPSSQLAYVTRSEANTVDVFDPVSMKLVKRIPVADDADGIFYDPFEKLVYVANGDAKLATLIDPATQTSIGTIPLGGKPEFAAIDSQTKLLYQNLEDTNTVVAVDLSKKSVVQRWPLEQCEGPSGMAIDEAHRRIFVVCSGNAKLVIFDLNAHRVTTSLPIGGGPDSVAFDPELHRIYSTGRAGVLSVVQQDTPDAYHALDSVQLHYGAHTLAIDPATHQLYVGYASLVVQPRLAVFTANR
jgi:YVTN family beta-propeller protein